MPTEPESPTLAAVVHRAALVCDPGGEHDDVQRLLGWFEDRDEPITSVADVDAALAEATTAIDPEGDDPALVMARAVATYLAFRRDEIADDRETILRLAARAEFDGDPPPPVADWLAGEGVEPT
jgi:putative intracellular protease/amidase